MYMTDKLASLFKNSWRDHEYTENINRDTLIRYWKFNYPISIILI